MRHWRVSCAIARLVKDSTVYHLQVYAVWVGLRDVFAAAPFQWAAIFHKEDINFEHGHHDLEWYDPTSKSTEHKLPCKVRCRYCHSPIMDEGRNMILMFPSLIDLNTQEARDKFKPRWVNVKSTWKSYAAAHGLTGNIT